MFTRLLTTTLLPLAVFATNACHNPIPARIQWENNFGYCGETSLISACLYYGQYLSQYDVRSLITDADSQQDQLLLGINDKSAAQQLHLDYEFWTSEKEQTASEFLSWIKQHAAQGHPVIIGIYANQWLLNQDPNPDDGDSDYDHIVPVTGFTSEHPLDDTAYYANDTLLFSDNGLYDLSSSHIFQSPFGSFQATREQANNKSGTIYSLATCIPSKKTYNYGIAIKGIKDLHQDTIRLRVDTNTAGETPEISDESNKRPAPSPLLLTLTISNLEPGIPYNLYRYNELDSVPESNFNHHASQATQHWTIQIDSGNSYSTNETIQSDQVAIYRCVKASAP